MAFIAPNSDFEFIQNVPLDNTYEHTLYFPSITAQNTYFASKVKTAETYSIPVIRVAGETPIESLSVSYSLTKQSYQRSGDNTLRVQIPADCLYDCNYCRYRNSAFNRKWFYAFITNVKYINTHVSEVTLEIDEMQTWFWHCTLMDSFVDREHTSDDTIGNNIVPEELDIGQEYMRINLQTYDMNEMWVCILITRNLVGDQPAWTSMAINNVYMPMRIYTEPLYTPSSNPPVLNPDIDTILNAVQEEEVVMVYEYPAVLGGLLSHPTDMVNGTIWIPRPTALDNNFVPENNKLFTYPYTCLMVTNNSGNTAMLNWESSDIYHAFDTQHPEDLSKAIELKIQGTFITTPCVICSPINYRGSGTNNPDYVNSLTYSNFPQCAWSGDTFKAWWAQNKGSFAAGILGEAFNFIGGTVGATVTGGATLPVALNGASGVINKLAKVYDMKHAPSSMYGQITTDSLNPALGRQRFDFISLSIKREYAEIIDEFFTKYGYATHRVKRPNIHARTRWTYTKTTDCFVEGYNTDEAYQINQKSLNVPASSVSKIASIFNNGITFWDLRDGTVIGDYSQQNPIYTPPPQNDNNS